MHGKMMLIRTHILWTLPLTSFIISYISDADGDYIDIKTDKWSSGGYRMDCQDKGSHTGWQCWASCSPFPNPNFLEWGYLTFEVKVSGTFDDLCKPSVSITKRWPQYGSNIVTLEGDYIDGGSTSESSKFYLQESCLLACFSFLIVPNLLLL